MADWSKIKTEYITTDTSYRKLAEKYGINKDTIYAKAKKEGCRISADSLSTGPRQKCWLSRKPGPWTGLQSCWM